MMRSRHYADIIAYKDYPFKGAVKPPTINKWQEINEISAATSSKKNNDGDNNCMAKRKIYIAAATSDGCIVWQVAMNSPHWLGIGKLPPI